VLSDVFLETPAFLVFRVVFETFFWLTCFSAMASFPTEDFKIFKIPA
jgi:hypothetical protein